jgi:hypothetical protein
MKQKITLSLDKDTIEKAKLIAAKRRTSISQMLTQELIKIVKSSGQYERAKKRALANLKAGYHLGGRIASSRERLHER